MFDFIMTQDLGSRLEKIALDASVKAAIACYEWIGKGDAHNADLAAVEAMRDVLVKQSDITGTVVIGEGERDEAPMLYIGEILGNGKIKCDIAVDPLEGTTLCANNMMNAMTTIAIGKAGSLLNAPDIYMEKIACVHAAKNFIDINLDIERNIMNLAGVLGKTIQDINVLILDRKRHEKMIQDIRNLGSKVSLIPDGDISAVIRATSVNSGVDLYVGSGGAPEGVLAACALKVLGGTFQAKLLFDKPNSKTYATKLGIKDFDKVYNVDDLVKDDVVCCITGVTKGDILSAVEINKQGHFATNSIIFNSFDKTKKEIWIDVL